jgi:uncharacterized protein (TIGR03067 family)
MKTFAFITMAALIIMTAGCATTPRDDLATLQGTWTGTEIGAAKPVKGTCQFIITGDRLEYRGANPQEWYKGTFSLPQGTDPCQLIGVIKECPFPEYVGKTSRAIYRIDGNTLTIAGHEPGSGTTPEHFERPHARVFVVTKQ